MGQRIPSYEEEWESHYRPGPVPFDLDEPLPWVVTLAEKGRIRGRVLDAGCGGGHNALYLARRGYDVVGIDVAPSAVSRARHKAGQQGVPAEFVVSDLVNSANWPGRFDTVVDIGCFHSLYPEDRTRYAAALHAACHPGALLHLRCFTDRKETGFAGPGTAGLSAADLEQSFADGWEIEELTAVVEDAFPEPRSWSRSWSAGRSAGGPDGRPSRAPETSRKRGPGVRPNGGDQIFQPKRPTGQFWFATVGRRP